MALMGVREYARHRDVSHAAVIKAIKTGRITRRKDGKIDSSKADAQWNGNTDVSKPRNSVTGNPKHRRRRGDPSHPKGSVAPERIAAAPHQPLPDEDDEIESGNGQGNGHAGGGYGPDYVTVQTIKATYAAKKAKVEYEISVGKLVDADHVRQTMYKAGRTGRDLVMALPDRLAPLVAAEADPDKVRGILEQECRAICAGIKKSLTLEEDADST